MIQQSHLLCIYPKEMKSVSWRDICTPMFISALFTIAKIRKQLKCLFVITGLSQEDIMLSEINQTRKDKYYMIAFICGIWKSRPHKIVVAAARGGGNGKILVKGTNSVITWINSQNLMYHMMTAVNSTILYTWKLLWD